MSIRTIYYKQSPQSNNVYELDRIDMTQKMFNIDSNGNARLISTQKLSEREMLNEAFSVAAKNHTFQPTNEEYNAVLDCE